MKLVDKLFLLCLVLLWGSSVAFCFALKMMSLEDLIRSPGLAALFVGAYTGVAYWLQSIAHERILRGPLFKKEAEA